MFTCIVACLTTIGEIQCQPISTNRPSISSYLIWNPPKPDFPQRADANARAQADAATAQSGLDTAKVKNSAAVKAVKDYFASLDDSGNASVPTPATPAPSVPTGEAANPTP